MPSHVRRWFVIACLVGLGFPLLMITVPLVFGINTIGPGCIGLFPILFAPFLIRHLFSRKALGIYVLRDDGISTTALGFNTACRAEDGWEAGELLQDAVNPHHWRLIVRRTGPGREDRFEIPIDDRIDDPRLVEAALRRSLAPRVAA